MSQKSTRWLELSFEELLGLAAARHYGAILRYFRRKRAWKAWELAMLYGEALRGNNIEDDEKPVTASWIYMMENQNMVPVDEKRRWILARLLEIPPVLFGLEELQSMIPASYIFTWEHVDIQEYRTALEAYCDGYRLGNGLQTLQDMRCRIANLQNDIHYRGAQEKRQMLDLLCGYLILAAIIVREHQDFETAINLLSKAIMLAEQGELRNLWGFALRQRGIVSVVKGEIAAYRQGFAAAQPDFETAILDFKMAQLQETHLSPLHKGLIALSLGAASAYVAQDRQELTAALKTLDKGSNQIGEGAEKIFMNAKFDEEMVQLDTAEIYLSAPLKNLCSPALARERLEQAEKATKFPMKTRQARHAFLLAKSYFVEGDYQMATACTGAAIDNVQGSISYMYLARLNYLYQGLLHSPYGTNTDVGELGVKLLKVQKPELFH